MKFLLLLLLAIPAFTQDLPDRGQLSDLKGRTKAYIVADGGHYKAIEKAIKKQYTLTSKASDADIFFGYKTLSRDEVGKTHMYLENGQLDVYYFRDKTQVVSWSSNKWGEDYKTAKDLVDQFLKEINKLK